MKNKPGKRKGARKPVGAQFSARGRTPAGTKKSKYTPIGEALATATPKVLASLLGDLKKGSRTVMPGVKLSTFEAGFLAAELSKSLKPKRRRRKKIELDHMN